jgi:threonine/homoserine/homoserine lactone efflux protein
MNLDLSLWLSMAGFAVATSITPGPNNTMLLASGVNFGFRATLPHALGINLGGLVLWVAVGLGLGQLFLQWPLAQDAMRVLGLMYVVYLAYRTWTSAGPAKSKTTAARPLSPWAAAAFQWVNPKVWFMVLGYFGSFMPDNTGVAEVLLASIWFSLFNFPCISLWAYAGARLQTFMSDTKYRRMFNAAMALLLVASMLPMVMQSRGVA